MKYIIGILLIFGGICLAGWLGIYIMLVGGITDAIEAYKAEMTNAVVWSIVKAVFFEAGIAVGVFVLALGAAIISEKE